MRRFLDPGLALALFVAGQVEAWTPLGTSLGSGSRAAAALTAAIAALALAGRHRAPVAVAALVALPTPLVALVMPVKLLFFGGLLPLLVAVYTLAATRRRRRDLVVLALPALGITALQVEIPEFHKPGEIVFDWICFAAAVAVG